MFCPLEIGYIILLCSLRNKVLCHRFAGIGLSIAQLAERETVVLYQRSGSPSPLGSKYTLSGAVLACACVTSSTVICPTLPRGKRPNHSHWRVRRAGRGVRLRVARHGRAHAPSFRGMIDLLSYTTMDLHAAWPVAGRRSSSRLLGVCALDLFLQRLTTSLRTYNRVW